jgi:hypothetical protein
MPADTNTPILGLLLQGTGNNDNTWGDNLNTFVIQYIEDAIAGRSAFTVTSADVTLTAAQARSMILDITGTLTANRNVIVPNASKRWTVRNGTAGSFTLSFQTASGSAVEVLQGGVCEVWCDGANGIYVSVSTARDRLADGTAALPIYSFSGDTDTGMYRIGANNLGFSVNGTKILDVDTSGLDVVGAISASTDISMLGDLTVGDDALVSGDLTVNLTTTLIGALTGAAATFSGILTLNATSHMKLPVGTTAQRSGTTQGSFRLNTTTGYPEYYNGGWVPLTPTSLPRGYIDGCILSNNATDSTNDIDFAAGVCRDSTNSVNIACVPATKQLDANWVAGTTGGMRNSAVGIANTTYHIYSVATAADVIAGTCSYYAHTSTDAATVLAALQAEVGGSLYLYVRLIGSIVRVGATIKSFIQLGDVFLWNSPVQDITNTADHTSAVLAALTVPTGLQMPVHFRANILNGAGSGNDGVLFTSPDAADAAPSATASPGVSLMTINSSRDGGEFTVRCDTSGRIRYRATNAAIDTWAQSIGFTHPRGKDAA